jgi:dihydrofolate synthase/folylpolyglutamate synthase
MMDYATALAYLLAPTDPSRPVVARPDAGQNLPRMRRLLDLLGAPDAHFASVVIAGTKGKGSTSAILASLLRAAGLRVGLYSQPHLHNYRERVRINGLPISPADLVASVERLQPAVARLAETPELGQFSTYDLGTALALDHFGAQGIDLAVLEVGLGGRYDSVNTIVPLVSVITSISIDHTAVLGDTIEQIASEKAGIIKPGVPVVTQAQVPAAAAVLTATATVQTTTLYPADTLVNVWRASEQPDPETGDQAILISFPLSAREGLGTTLDDLPPVFRLPLLGQFQRRNVATALAAALLLAKQGRTRLDADIIARGLVAVRWPGRLEIVGREPLTLVDGAHNADSAAQLRDALADLFPGRPLTLVLGTSLDKDIPGIADALVPAASRLILTASIHPRSASLDLLHRATDHHAIPTDDAPTVAAALDRARLITPPGGLICATGSLFVVADARAHLGLGDEAVAV